MANNSTLTPKPAQSTVASQPNRLAKGGQIERSLPLSFEFDGQQLGAFSGDSLASALLANDIKLVARSFKYHRPRGIFSAGSEEPNALMTLGKGKYREPNCKATSVELYEGMAARTQNAWPSIGFDVGALASAFSPFLPAGFYYKTFMWPSAFWERIYEPIIRQAAGLGSASTLPDPDQYDVQHEFCDLLIVGSGPAGLAAAIEAGRAGLRIMLCDEDFAMGGRLSSEKLHIGDQNCAEWANSCLAELASMPNVRICASTAIVGRYDGCTYLGVQKLSGGPLSKAQQTYAEKLWIIVPAQVIMSTGATERSLVFGGNDRPGIMLASAVRTYINRFAVAPGKRAAIFTCCDDGWRTINDLKAAGVEVVAVIDSRETVKNEVLALGANSSAKVMLGATVIGTKGWKGLRQISVSDQQGDVSKFEVDLLAVSGGWNPNIALATHLGGKPIWCEEISSFKMASDDRVENVQIVGAAAGQYSLGAALNGGLKAASLVTGIKAKFVLPKTDDECFGITPLWVLPKSVGKNSKGQKSRGKAFVDLQNDVTNTDIDLAWREGFKNPEHIKRYTTMGMGTDQGRTGTVNGLAQIAEANNEPMGLTGNITGRPPYVPVRLGTIAGLHRGKYFRPTRRTSAHEAATELDAHFVETGEWLRPQWYTKAGETNWLQSVTREAEAVRKSVGVCDVSTLGKIDVQGSDAAEFLNRVYINNMAGVAVNKVRYGVMLREDGFVMDDGTAARFGQNHFVISTTTANAGKIMQHLYYCHQVLWPELDVQMISVTEQWAQYAIAGPNSAKAMKLLVGDYLDLSDEAFGFMACAEFSLDGIPARAFRVSFSGERAYEIAVPAQYGQSIFNQLLSLGKEWDITPYGTDALAVLRIEKGHVSGPELVGQTTAKDLGFGGMMSKKKDFIGRVLAGRAALIEPDRPSLVGVRPVLKDDRFSSGAQFLPVGSSPVADNCLGYISSVAYSPHVGSWIGLGLIAGGSERIGEKVRAYDPVRNKDTLVEIVSPVFIDPKGARLRA
ncbi:MAG: sarcosine oxidase subunit alpha family protein [Devosiaceae bacterium]|nr:sarcosine oxidase subunit alpha family protein [Devosiaceae bacterium]